MNGDQGVAVAIMSVGFLIALTFGCPGLSWFVGTPAACIFAASHGLAWLSGIATGYLLRKNDD